MARGYKSPDEWAQQADGFAGRLQKMQKTALTKASMEAKTILTSSIRQAVGPDMRMSGVGRRGAKVGVQWDIKGHTNPTSLVRATGPLHFVERSSRPHRIPKLRARGRKRYAVIPGVGVRASANHPGTKAKRPWARAVPLVAKAVPRVYAAELSAEIRKSFRI